MKLYHTIASFFRFTLFSILFLVAIASSGQNSLEVQAQIKDLNKSIADEASSRGELQELIQEFSGDELTQEYLWVSQLLQKTYLDSNEYSFALFRKENIFSTDSLDRVSAYLYSNLLFGNGVAYFQMSEIDSSILSHQYSLELRIASFDTEQDKIAQSHSYLGYLYRYRKNDSQKALHHYSAQLKALLLIGDQTPALAQCYYNLSATYGLLEDYSIALTYAYKALDLANDLLMPAYFRSYCLTSIANNHQLLREYEKASVYFQKSLSLMESELGEDDPNLLIILNNLGVSLQEVGLNDSAKAYFQRSLEMTRKHYGDTHIEVANTFMLLGLNELQNEKGKDWVLKAIGLYKNISAKNEEKLPLAYCRLSKWFVNHNQYDSAVYYAQKALYGSSTKHLDRVSVNRIVSHSHKLIALRSLAFASFKKAKSASASVKDLENAIGYYILLDSCMTYAQKRLKREKSRLSFFSRYREDYEQALELCYDLVHTHKELEYNSWFWSFIEKNKANILLETMAKMEAADALQVPKRIQSLEMELRAAFERLRNETDPSSSESLNMQRELLVLEQRQDSLINQIKEKFPSYYAFKYGSNASLKEVQARMSKESQLMCQYFEGQEYFFTMSVSKFGLETLKIKKNEVLTHLNPLLSILHEGFNYQNRLEDFNTYKVSGYQLYLSLLAPLLKEVPVKDLIISPDGRLSLLAYEALLSKEPTKSLEVDYSVLPYLLFNKDLSYTFSASIYMMQKPSSDLEINHLKCFTTIKSELPSSEIESDKIKSAITDASIFKGETSSKASFLKEIEKGDVLHLSLHNFNNHQSASASGLLFNGQDSLLSMHELYQQRVSAKLVFLSACESGVGKYEAGEGMYSLGRGFQFAGVPTVIMSLWKIPDTHTPTLSSAFYSELKQNIYSTKALSKAKQNFIKQSDNYNSHPSNWSAFVHIGPNQKQSPNWKMYLIFGPVVFVLFLLFSRIRRAA
jgi:CHAT domain-containing protein